MRKVNRNLISALLVFFLLAGIIPIPSAIAAGSIELTVTPSLTSVEVGQEVTFTISMGSASGTDFAGFGFEIWLAPGITYKTGSGAVSPAFTSATGMAATFDESPKLMVSGYYTGSYYNGAGLTIATFVCTVEELGPKMVTLVETEFYGGDSVDPISTTVNSAHFTGLYIMRSLDVTLTAPVLGATPQTDVSGFGYTGSVVWSGTPVTFGPSTAYSATIEIHVSWGGIFGTFAPTVNSSLVGEEKFYGGTSLAFTVTFPATAAKNDVSSTIGFNGNTFTYDSLPKSLPAATTTDGTGGSFTYRYIGTEYDSLNPPTNAGTYTVTATYESEISIGTKTATLIIAPLPLSINGVTVGNRAYDGTTNVILSGGSLTGVLPIDASALGFNLGTGQILSAEVGVSKAVATSIVLTGAKSANYTLSQPGSLTVDITPADIAYSVADTQSIKVGSGLDAINVAPAVGIGVGGAEVAGTVVWYNNSMRTTTATNADINSLNVDDTVALYWRFTPNGTNYMAKEGLTTFTIVEGDPQPMTFASSGNVTKTYGEAAFANTASHNGGSATKGEITYSSSDASIAIVNATTGMVTITGAGTVVITASAAAVPGIWAATTEVYNLTVNKATPTLADLDFTLPGNVTYDATSHASLASPKSSVSGIGAIASVKYNGIVEVPVNVGTYNVTVEIEEGINYREATISLGSFTISPKALTDSMLVITGTYEYDGSVQSPIFNVEDSSAVSSDDYNVTALPSRINAGSYPLVITGTRNYSGTAQQSFIISKITPTLSNLEISIPAASDYSGDSSMAFVRAGIGMSGLGDASVFYNGVAQVPVDAGTYFVTVDIEEGMNYTEALGLAIGTITINPKTETSIDREFFVKSGLGRSYEFDLSSMLPMGVAIEQISSYSYIGSSGDGILDGTPAISGSTLIVPILDTAVEAEEAYLTIGFTSHNYVITDAILTVTASGGILVDVSGVNVATRQYNGSAISYDSSGLVFTDIITGDIIHDLYPIYSWSSGVPPVNAGSYTLTISADGGTAYTISPQFVYFNITKAPLTLVADNNSIRLNETLPAYTFSVSGLVAPDTWETISVQNPYVQSPSADAGTVGTYPILIGGGELDGVNGANYAISQYTSGTLVVRGSGGTSSGGGSSSGGGGSIDPPSNPAVGDGDNSPITQIDPEPVPLPILPVDALNPFIDVFGTNWFFADVLYVHSAGIMTGTSTDPMMFSPNSTLTRAMIVSVLYRHCGEPDSSGYANPFHDVLDGQYFTNAVIWAAGNGIVDGYGDGRFGFSDPVTRQDLAVILLRYMRFLKIDLGVSEQWIQFADDADISAYAMEALQILNRLDIINGVDINSDAQITIRPRGNATRAQVAAMLHRFMLAIR